LGDVRLLGVFQLFLTLPLGKYNKIGPDGIRQAFEVISFGFRKVIDHQKMLYES
jgi:hypothetical protein